MASTSSRRVGSHRTHERPSSKSDDPWCLICGVNLALDGRTFTVVSSHQNSELCDVFLRVLAMTFTQENAFVNVCNRCERQLKRLGRTTSIAMARQEGRKFREQVEGNVAKHGLQGVALGDFRNLNITAPGVSSKADNSASSSGTMRRAETVDESSSARKGREMYSRSNSSVRFEDKESGKRGAYSRDLSAPERKVQARELHSSVNESSDRNKEVRRGTRSGSQTAGVERTASFKTISDERRTKTSIPSQKRGPPTRDGKPSIQKMNSVDLPQKSGKVTTTTFARDVNKMEPSKSQAERKQHPGKPDNNKKEHRENNNVHNDSWELSSGELNPFTADIELENSNVDNARAFDEQARRQIQHAFQEYQARDASVLNDDDQFIQAERAVLMESSQSSHSSNEAVDDDEKPRADPHGSSPQFCVGTDGQTLPIGDENERPAEQLAAEDESRDRARRLRVTFSENAGTDVSDETSIKEHSGSSQARQDSARVKTASDTGDLQQDSSPLIAGTEDNREEEVKAVYDFQEHGGVLQVKAGDDTGESVKDTAEGEGDDWRQEEHGLIETDRLQQEAEASETADVVLLELTTSSSFVRHSPDSTSSLQPSQLYSVSKVIQVTHLQPSVQLDDVDLKGDEEQTFVKDASDQSGSQVSIEPMQVEVVSATKSEATPLIDKDEGKGDKAAHKGKDSKFKDQQPGLPCCTIL